MTNEEMASLVQDYKLTFGPDHGKRVLDDLRQQLFYDGDIFQPGQQDMTQFRLGLREAYKIIKKTLMADPEAIMALQEVSDNEEEP